MSHIYARSSYIGYPTCTRCLPLVRWNFQNIYRIKRFDIILDSEILCEHVSCFVSYVAHLKKKSHVVSHDRDRNGVLPRDEIEKLLIKHLAQIMFRRFVSRGRNEMKCIQKSIKTLHGSRLLWGVSQEFAKNQ